LELVDAALPVWNVTGPGSSTYCQRPTKLTKAPMGSTFSHYLKDPVTGQPHLGIYRIRPDRPLEIIGRHLRGRGEH